MFLDESEHGGESLAAIRDRLLDRVLAIAAFLAVPALIASLVRAREIDWRFSMTVQVVLLLVLWGTVLFRTRLTFRYRSIVLVLILSMLSVSSFVSFGLVSGPYGAIVAIVVITLLFGRRAGLFAFAGVLVLICAMYLAVAGGYVDFDQDFNAYMVSLPAWVNSFFSMVLNAAGVVLIVGGLYEALTSALLNAEAKAAKIKAIATELETRAAEQETLLAGYRGAIARLTESEDRYRLIAGNTSDFLWILDLGGNFIHVGGACEALTGYTPAEVMSLQLEERYTEESACRVRRMLSGIAAKVEAGGVPPDGDITVECIKKDGERSWHEARYHPTRSLSGETVVTGISRDVTARVMADREIAENSRLLAGLDSFNRVMASKTDIDEMMGAVLTEVLNIFRCDRAFLLYPCDPEAESWSASMERTVAEFPGVGELGRKIPMRPYFASVMGRLLETDEPLQTLASEVPGEQAVFDEALNVKSRLMLAVRPRMGSPWVFGVHQCSRERLWTEGERELFKQIGARFADGLSMALLLKDLRQSEERFRSIVSTMADWVWECDINGRFTFASERIYEILGYTQDEAVGLYFHQLLMPGEIDRVRREVSAAARNKAPIKNMENWNRTKEGRPVCILTNGIPLIDAKGKVVGYRGVDVDITERKLNEQALAKSERKFRDLFQSASVGIILANGHHQIVDANTEALRALGYTLTEIRKIGCESLLDPSEPHARPLVSFDSSGQGETVSRNRRFVRRNGSALPVLVSVSGSMDGLFIVMFQDMTALQKVEQQLFQAQKMEAVGTLAGGIAHDFNNILQAIMGFSHLLGSETSISPKAHAYIERIGGSAERGAALVKNMLTFSSPQPSETRCLDAGAEAARTVEFVSRTLPRNIEIRTDFDLNAPKIEADPSQLEQVLINLATNARDAMESGGVLSFSTRGMVLGREGSTEWAGAPPGEYLLLTVADTGTGIAADVLPHVFEPFYTTKEVGKGTGLGLSTAYGIVKKHNGLMRCESKPGATVFSIILPARVGTKGGIPVDAEYGETQPEPLHAALTVLVVDDEDFVREVAEEGLKAAGHAVRSVASGEAALLAVNGHEHEFQVVVLDLGMPGMGGEKCLELLLEADPGLKIIVASGYGVTEVVEQLMASGAAAFLKKPYRIGELAEAVARVGAAGDVKTGVTAWPLNPHYS